MCDQQSLRSAGRYAQGLKIVLVRSYLRVSQAAGQVNILIFLLKIKFSPCMPINFVMQGKCLFSDISRPDAQSDQSLCFSLEYSISVKLLNEHHLEFLSLTGCCTGSPESTLVKIPWKSCQSSYVIRIYALLCQNMITACHIETITMA